MSDPITTLLELNTIQLACDEVQQWIDHGREMFPTDQAFQLEMDRRQTEIDDKRMFVATLRRDISMRN